MARRPSLNSDYNLIPVIHETPGALSEKSSIFTASLNVSFICLSPLKLGSFLKRLFSFFCCHRKWTLLCFPFISHKMLKLVSSLLPNVACRLYSPFFMLKTLFLLDHIVIVVHIFLNTSIN